jgi:lipoprotein NlpI
MAKHFKTQGRFGKAMSMYKLAISLNVYDYVEHGYSFLELGKLYREYKAANKAGNPNKFVNVQ